jgi:hypothetical protein
MDLLTENTDMRKALRFAAHGYVVPAASDFSWVNQGTASATDQDGLGIRFISPGASLYAVRGLVRSVPATPFTVEVLMTHFMNSRANHVVGLLQRDSGSGRCLLTGFYASSQLISDRANSPTSFNSNSHYFAGITNNVPPTGWKLVDDGTNHTVHVTFDDENWIQCGSASRTAWLANPDQWGVAINSNDSITPVNSHLNIMTIRSYKVY